jgi:hypothetical protein
MGTRRASSAGRAIDPGSARTGGRREMAQSPSPPGMMGGTAESGTAGFPEQSAPEQGVRRDGGVLSWAGSTDPLRISGSRANVSVDACIHDVTWWAEQPARAAGAGAPRSMRSDRIAPSLRGAAVPWAENRMAAPDSGGRIATDREREIR